MHFKQCVFLRTSELLELWLYAISRYFSNAFSCLFSEEQSFGVHEKEELGAILCLHHQQLKQLALKALRLSNKSEEIIL